MSNNMDRCMYNNIEQCSSASSAWICPLQPETKPQTDQAWPQLNSQNQMKHNTQRNESYCNRRYVTDLTTGMCSNDSLGTLEYPILGERKAKVRNMPDVVSCQEIIIIESVKVPVRTNAKHTKTVGYNKYKRTDKISFDLQKALRNAQFFTSKKSKRSTTLKNSLYKVNTNSSFKSSSSEKNVETKKVKVYGIKLKRKSRLKRKILRERWINRQKRHQESRDNKKIEENTIDVNSISLDVLKIKPDPTIDIDYVKRMSTLTVHDKNYRDVKVDNIPEDSVEFRPDVTQKLNALRISNCREKNVFTTPYKTALDNTDDLMMLQHTLSLKDETDVDVKPDIKSLSDRNEFIRYSKNFREYCNNLITPSLNKSLEEFLSEIKRLQTKLYVRNQNKGKYKRRYYSGLKEVQKYVGLKKIRFVVIAPDIEKIQSEDGLDQEIDKLLEICRKNETVFCFGLRRRKLGYYAHGNGLVGCIGIANYGNAEQLFWNVLVEITEARNKFEELLGRSEKTIEVSKIIPENGVVAENIGALLKTLASIN